MAARRWKESTSFPNPFRFVKELPALLRLVRQFDTIVCTVSQSDRIRWCQCISLVFPVRPDCQLRFRRISRGTEKAFGNGCRWIKCSLQWLCSVFLLVVCLPSSSMVIVYHARKNPPDESPGTQQHARKRSSGVVPIITGNRKG